MNTSESSAAPTKVAIVGAGIGGLCTALALARRGIGSVVYERASVLAEVGAGLQLSPNAMRVIDRLGLGDAVRAAGDAPPAAHIRRARDRRKLLTMPLGPAAETRWGAPYLQIHRADLQALLVAAVHRATDTELKLDAAVANVDSCGEVQFESGERERATAIVIADGLRSRLRQRVTHADDAPTNAGDVAWRALVPASALALDVPSATHVWTGPARHFVHYPLRGGTLINLVGVTRAGGAASESWHEAGDPAEFADHFRDWPEPVAALARAADSVGRWALHHRPPATRLAHGRCALLGDAGHPVLPYMAQGAAMAIEDAATLAGALADTLVDNPSRAATDSEAVAAALRRYESLRLARVRRVQRASARNARLFHLPDPLAGTAFGAARLLNRGHDEHNMAKLDWLYGGGPVSGSR